ncbi:hypothetical protein HELRODRAFT_160195 [Helobdella robusta]|uniref:Uncharacterized protein n=1 Tax=Helobdella robusta TaxID=6412 RepID=T1EPY2_HELRO|nr:hypothetical protein HELRODRAFT_160195 [Helobdella robusta]ESO06065.1 hypothetical protein HELRODRAFT_160195 [Helobdella robusta]
MEKDEETRYILKKLIYTDYERYQNEPPVLKKPEYHKAKISIWADLKYENVEVLNSATTVEELQNLLSTFYDLEDYKENKRSAILIDFYTYLLQFAKENCFNIEQTSAFFSILKQTNDICIGDTRFENGLQWYASDSSY